MKVFDMNQPEAHPKSFSQKSSVVRYMRKEGYPDDSYTVELGRFDDQDRYYAEMVAKPTKPAKPARVASTNTTRDTNKANPNSQSSISSPCKQVWEIADANPDLKRSEVIKLCENAGIAYNTARTQYQQWFTASKASTKK